MMQSFFVEAAYVRLYPTGAADGADAGGHRRRTLLGADGGAGLAAASGAQPAAPSGAAWGTHSGIRGRHMADRGGAVRHPSRAGGGAASGKAGRAADCLRPALSGKTVRLCVGKDGGTARQAAQVLAKRARYIELTPPGQTALAQWLLARYGVAAGSGGQQAAAVVWCGTADSVSEGPAIYLGAACAARQEVRYEAAGLAPWPVSEQLLAALLAADGWEASEIHVVSVVSRA